MIAKFALFESKEIILLKDLDAYKNSSEKTKRHLKKMGISLNTKLKKVTKKFATDYTLNSDKPYILLVTGKHHDQKSDSYLPYIYGALKNVEGQTSVYMFRLYDKPSPWRIKDGLFSAYDVYMSYDETDMPKAIKKPKKAESGKSVSEELENLIKNALLDYAEELSKIFQEFGIAVLKNDTLKNSINMTLSNKDRTYSLHIDTSDYILYKIIDDDNNTYIKGGKTSIVDMFGLASIIHSLI